MDSEHPMRDEPVADLADEEGGDPVCWAHLVCLECGAVTTEGHRPGCQSAGTAAGAGAGDGDGQVRREPWSG
ncbi:MAG: hypothetical protein WA805_15805 [Trebonia sp.]|uniref:hypothetical protein n=1 Tax=Trebonia sp. TaxID=2767075 RepID=UPI003CA3B0CB